MTNKKSAQKLFKNLEYSLKDLFGYIADMSEGDDEEMEVLNKYFDDIIADLSKIKGELGIN